MACRRVGAHCFSLLFVLPSINAFSSPSSACLSGPALIPTHVVRNVDYGYVRHQRRRGPPGNSLRLLAVPTETDESSEQYLDEKQVRLYYLVPYDQRTGDGFILLFNSRYISFFIFE